MTVSHVTLNSSSCTCRRTTRIEMLLESTWFKSHVQGYFEHQQTHKNTLKSKFSSRRHSLRL